VACSDSRVVPNLFASSDPGDLFVVRNVGNLIPPCLQVSPETPRGSAAAALEYAVCNLKVKNVIICGHSECGGMRALLEGEANVATTTHLHDWLRHGEDTVQEFKRGRVVTPGLTPINQISQINVLVQMLHVGTYPFISERMASGEIQIHGWWFDIARADVFAYEPEDKAFALVEEAEAERILARLEARRPHGSAT